MTTEHVLGAVLRTKETVVNKTKSYGAYKLVEVMVLKEKNKYWRAFRISAIKEKMEF